MELYNYVFHYNHHEDLWYGIHRDNQHDYWNGERKGKLIYSSKEIKDVIKLIKDDGEQ